MLLFCFFVFFSPESSCPHPHLVRKRATPFLLKGAVLQRQTLFWPLIYSRYSINVQFLFYPVELAVKSVLPSGFSSLTCCFNPFLPKPKTGSRGRFFSTFPFFWPTKCQYIYTSTHFFVCVAYSGFSSEAFQIHLFRLQISIAVFSFMMLKGKIFS